MFSFCHFLFGTIAPHVVDADDSDETILRRRDHQGRYSHHHNRFKARWNTSAVRPGLEGDKGLVL